MAWRSSAVLFDSSAEVIRSSYRRDPYNVLYVRHEEPPPFETDVPFYEVNTFCGHRGVPAVLAVLTGVVRRELQTTSERRSIRVVLDGRANSAEAIAAALVSVLSRGLVKVTVGGEELSFPLCERLGDVSLQVLESVAAHDRHQARLLEVRTSMFGEDPGKSDYLRFGKAVSRLSNLELVKTTSRKTATSVATVTPAGLVALEFIRCRRGLFSAF